MQDLTGQRFGRLYVVKRIGFVQYKDRRLQEYLCLCDCGNYCNRTINNLKTKNRVHSCGCFNLERIKKIEHKGHPKHGLWNTRLYKIHDAMKGRCINQNNYAYKYYGGRGICVCDEWLGENGFKNFYKWALENGYSEELTLDRIDTNSNYTPNNCRWITRKEQMENTRRTRKITHNNETHSLTWWAKKYGIPRTTLFYRLERGLSFEEAIKFGRRKAKVYVIEE